MRLTKWSMPAGVLAHKFRDPYQGHRSVSSLLDAPGHEVLWYLDRGQGCVYALSDKEPTSGECVQTKEVSDEQMAGSKHYHLRVLVNAVKTVGGKRIPMKGYDQVRGWFAQREGSQGFRFVAEPTIGSSEDHKAWKGKMPITISGTEVEGYIEVTDKEKFLASVRNGIGKSKSFGYGMMRILPVREIV